MAIDTTALIRLFREDMTDPEMPGTGTTPDEDSLWSDAEIIRYLDVAQEEFCRHVDALPDGRTFSSPITADDPWVKVDPRITRIRKGRMQTLKRTLLPRTLRDMERGELHDDYGMQVSGTNGWEDQVGTPSYVVTDLEKGKGRLSPIPKTNDTILWSVYRLPKASLVDGAALEIDSQYRRGLLLKAKAQAYLKHDTETKGKTESEKWEGKWDDFLLEVDRELKRKRRRAQTTTYGGL